MIVMCSGKFDPIHDGHIDHIVKASALGDSLLVIAQSDEAVVTVKGKCEIPIWARLVMLRGILLYYNISGRVEIGIDTDGKSIQSLRYFHPDIYAKGGDRTPDNIPKEEVSICNELGIRIIYGIGGLLNSSSKMTIGRVK